jgi:hypothetical protein
MQDIVKIFHDFSQTQSWIFSYGNQANQNLLQSNLDTNQVYFLLDPVRRLKAFSEFGGSGYKSFEGSFLLVVKSNIDQLYFESLEEGKYGQNIEPLLRLKLPKLENELNCSDYRIDAWNIIDVTDIFDINLDGIIVNYKISVL